MTHSRLPNFSRLVSGGAEEAGMKGWRGRAADVFADHGASAAKMKSAPVPGTLDSYLASDLAASVIP